MAELDWHAERGDVEGLAQLDREPDDGGIDLVAVRGYRLGRVRAQMERLGVDALIVSDPVNIRYATGARNMQVFSMRNAPSRYLLLTAERSILFEFTGCLHLADGLETIDEVRPARTASFVAAGQHIVDVERAWAADMAAELTRLVGPKPTVGLERLNAGVAIALAAAGVRVVDAQHALELARSVKSAEELACVTASLRATEIGVAALRDAIRPGLTEAQLWSVLHASVIAQNGDYIETRLLSAGSRTNPWFQETSDNVIGPDELVAVEPAERLVSPLGLDLTPRRRLQEARRGQRTDEAEMLFCRDGAHAQPRRLGRRRRYGPLDCLLASRNPHHTTTLAIQSRIGSLGGSFGAAPEA